MTFDRRAPVLIADADPVVSRKLSKCLLDSEVFADCFADGKTALEALAVSSYAVVVLDLALPPGNAERILDLIAAMPGSTRPVVLVLAARGAARSLDVEVVQIVLRKPCDLNQLSQIVKSCVRSAGDTRRADAATQPVMPRQQPIV